jgi:hypothetical protein
LFDFRKTSRLTFLKEDEKNKDEVNKLRKESKYIGKTTWFLVYSQIITFLISNINIFIAISITYYPILF